ncbi:hypothetical protein STEG23_003158 [Scotinomys teguina]
MEAAAHARPSARPPNSPPRAQPTSQSAAVWGPRLPTPAAGIRLEAAAREGTWPLSVHQTQLDRDPTRHSRHDGAALVESRAGALRHLDDVTAERQRFLGVLSAHARLDRG